MKHFGQQPLPDLTEISPDDASNEYRMVCVRLRSAEFDQFAKEIGPLGLTNSMALRIAARRIGGFLEVDSGLQTQLEGVLTAVGDISRSIRALHNSYLVDGTANLDQLEAQRTAFGREFAQLDGLLRSILNVSRRRTDGRQLLNDAMK